MQMNSKELTWNVNNSTWSIHLTDKNNLRDPDIMNQQRLHN